MLLVRGSLYAADGALEIGDLLFEFLDLLARAQEDTALNVELFARDQIEIAQARLQRTAERCGQILARLLQAWRHQGCESLREFIDTVDIDHGNFTPCAAPYRSGAGTGSSRARACATRIGPGLCSSFAQGASPVAHPCADHCCSCVSENRPAASEIRPPPVGASLQRQSVGAFPPHAATLARRLQDGIGSIRKSM